MKNPSNIERIFALIEQIILYLLRYITYYALFCSRQIVKTDHVHKIARLQCAKVHKCFK